MTKKIYIASVVEVWKGKSKFNPDKDSYLFLLTAQDGKKYTTDNPKYTAMVGQEVEVMTEMKPSKKLKSDGTPYMNEWIVEPKRNVQVGGFTEMDRKVLYSLYRKVEALQTALAPTTIDKAPQNAEISPETPIVATDLPF